MWNSRCSLTMGIVFCLFILTGALSCKKPETNPDNTSKTGSFLMHLHTNIDTTEVEDYGVSYTTAEGRRISLDLAQLYISKVQLEKEDGSFYDFPGTIVLKRFEEETYEIGDAPVGNYKSVRFHVGLDAETNMEDPATAADSATLNHSEMWFGSNAQPDGYVFVNLQGLIDTSASGDDTVGMMQAFMYKIGTNANYKGVALPEKPFTIVEDQPYFIHVTIDYGKLLEGIDFSQAANLKVTTAVDNSSATAQTLAGNITMMFRYEE